MKQKPDLTAQIQKELRDSQQYDEAMDMLVNLVSQLNEAGRVAEAFSAQETLLRLQELRKSILSIPVPGFTAWK